MSIPPPISCSLPSRGAAQRLPLAPDEVHVWTIHLDRIAAHNDDRSTWLSPEERERASRFHFARDRDRFVAGRSCLRAILGAYVERRPGEVAIATGPAGKPHLEGESGRIQFNLSHCGGEAVLAVARGRALGVDLERVRSLDGRDRIAERFFAPGEAEWLASVPEAGRTRAFFQIWTRKEAYLKAIGWGLSVALDSFSLPTAPEGRPARVNLPDADGRDATWGLLRLPLGEDFEGALVVEGTDWTPLGFEFEPGR